MEDEKRMGRPPKGDEAETSFIALKVSNRQKAWLDSEATDQGVTLSRIIKDLIDEAMERSERRNARISK